MSEVQNEIFDLLTILIFINPLNYTSYQQERWQKKRHKISIRCKWNHML